jgi:large subunit ribosomal protein L30
MSTIKIKQVKSRIGAPADQKRTLDALGLHKLNRVVEHECTPSILDFGPVYLAISFKYLIVIHELNLLQPRL